MKTLLDFLDRRSEIEAAFTEYFCWCPHYPTFKAEHRVNEKANFEGFWIMGDGPGVKVENNQAIIDSELLLNVVISQNEYLQFELQATVLDLKYYNDYIGYFNTRGKVLKHIGKRLEVLMHMLLVTFYDQLTKNPQYTVTINIEELFSEKQLRKTILAGKKIIRANDWVITKRA